jgi:hypothetical protein
LRLIPLKPPTKLKEKIVTESFWSTVTGLADLPTRGPEKYGINWEYRVFSILDTEPDAANSGHRILVLRRVWPRERYPGSLPDYPIPDDVALIDDENISLAGNSIEELRLELTRMAQALDKPALNLAEWKCRIVRHGKPLTFQSEE